jgi:hypothetical protein
MSLNESIVEDAALEWFGEQRRVAPTLIPAFSRGEKEEDGEVLLVGRLREAIRRLNLSIWDLASGETWRKCQGTTKIKLISIRLPITKKLLTFDSLVVDEH